MSAYAMELLWREHVEDAATYPKGSGTLRPTGALDVVELHRLFVLLKDVRIIVTLDGDSIGSVSCDFLASATTGFVAPTETSRKSSYGLDFDTFIDAAGVLEGGGASGFYIRMNLGIDDPGSIHNTVVIDGNDHHPVLLVFVGETSADNNASSLDPDPGSPGDESVVTCTFFGYSIPMFFDQFDFNSGSITIEAPPTDGYLSFGGIRDADTGAALITSF